MTADAPRDAAPGSQPAGDDSWQKPSQSTDGSNCVEVTVTYDTSGSGHKSDSEKLYLMRDSKNPDGPVLAFTPAEWEAFILGVKDGEFDIAP
ncbi:MAG: DUF397 domain-containing protein [Gemmatimonadota bacterium]